MYKDRTRHYDPKARDKERHPMVRPSIDLVTPFPFSRITAYKTTSIM